MNDKNSKNKVVVALSGGVDSAVSAALLKRDGFDVTAVFMKCWDDPDMKFGCTAEEDEREARRVAAHLDIPLYTFDLVEEYREHVIDYFVGEYARGRTPNPDIMCNKEIKFGAFFKKATEDMGADYVATGHYARISSAVVGLQLLKGKDANKDQSYFLYRLGQEHLKKTLFPIGEYDKPEVRELAREFGLPNAERSDSQGICFMGKISIQDFLKEYIPSKSGPIVTHEGKNIGEHEGLHLYTIGQRRGINVGGGIPYYVASKDYKSNTLHVAYEHDESLFAQEAYLEDMHWIGEPLLFPAKKQVKIRYRQADQSATFIQEGDRILVQFDIPQRAVTSGQSAVLYSGEQCLGGGIIV